MIIAVIYATKAVAKRKPEKNSGLNGIQTHDLCDTGAVLFQCPEYQTNSDCRYVGWSYVQISAELPQCESRTVMHFVSWCGIVNIILCSRLWLKLVLG